MCLGSTRPVVGEDAPIEHEVAALEALHVVGPLEEVALHAGAIHAACGREDWYASEMSASYGPAA